jgi:hypothetical protein
VLYPRAPVHMLVTLGFYFTRIVVPAYLMLGYWFLLQILGGIPALRARRRRRVLGARRRLRRGLALLPLFRVRERVERTAATSPSDLGVVTSGPGRWRNPWSRSE